MSTLTGESLSGSSSSGNTTNCSFSSFSVTGAATGPYPGTFAEAGTWDVVGVAGHFDGTFTITSGTTTITGSKTGEAFGGGLSCTQHTASGTFPHLTYAATIHTPNGNFHDEGTSGVNVTNTDAGEALLSETFTSSLTAPVLIVPTSKDQCKNNGWKNFPQFKNQGQCVSFVERRPRT